MIFDGWGTTGAKSALATSYVRSPADAGEPGDEELLLEAAIELGGGAGLGTPSAGWRRGRTPDRAGGRFCTRELPVARVRQAALCLQCDR